MGASRDERYALGMRRRWSILVLTAALAGCDKDPDYATFGEPAPATTETEPTTQPVRREQVATEPATVLVNGEPYLLPPMRLGAQATDAGLNLQLYGSDDQRNATGNALYLVMQVGAQSPQQLQETPWRFESLDEAWVDTPVGLTLSEERWVLRPAAVELKFAPGDGVIEIDLRGTFLMWDIVASADAAPRRVHVEGTFAAALVAE